MPWIANKPAAGDTLASSQPDINNNFDAINTALDVEHVGHVSAQTAGVAGRHKFALGGTGARPATNVAGGYFIRTDVTPAFGEYFDGSAWQTIGINSGTQTFGGAKTFTAAITFTDTVTLGTDPTTALQAATKQYVDKLGLTTVRIATTGNVSVSSAPAVVDGITAAENDVLLLKNQTVGTEDGLYDYPASSGSALTRTNNWDTSDTPTGSTVVHVQEGTDNADTSWMLTNDGTITPGTTDMIFTPQAVANAGQLPTATEGTNSYGYTYLPNGVLLQFGREGDGTADGAGTSGTVTFPVAFLSGEVPVVQLTIDTSQSQAGATPIAARHHAISNTAFTWHAFDGSGTQLADFVLWTAHGRWR